MFIIYDHILRYDPSSAEWVAVLTEQKANTKTVSKRKADGPKNKKTSAKKQKTSNKENNSDLIV